MLIRGVLNCCHYLITLHKSPLENPQEFTMNILKFTYALDQLKVQHLKLNNLIESTDK